MIDSFSQKELEAIDRLLRDEDFVILVSFIRRNCTALASKACQIAGIDSERIKGGSCILQELRDNILLTRDVLKRQKEQSELPDGRDTISP